MKNMLLKEKEKIETWLNQYQIKNYELIEDQEYGYIVNVNSNVFLQFLPLKNIRVKFNIINGDFICSFNKLETLKGCPEIVNGDFLCRDNELVSLKYSPKIVKGTFNCCFNKLELLEDCPHIIEGNFYCNNNKLTSLKGGPKEVYGILNCSVNLLNIEGLKYLPDNIEKNYIKIKFNHKLGLLQDIESFLMLKEKVEEILKPLYEKEKIDSKIYVQDLNKKKIMNKI